MTELLPNLKNRKEAHPSDESLQMRVCRADLHGALVKVTRSNVASQVGTEGKLWKCAKKIQMPITVNRTFLYPDFIRSRFPMVGWRPFENQSGQPFPFENQSCFE
jgi:hypothetical protein